MFQDINSKKAITRSRSIGLVQIVLGGVFTLMFGLSFIVCFADLFDPEGTLTIGVVIFVLVFLLLSIYPFIRGIRRLIITDMCASYMMLLNQSDSHSIAQLADFLKAPANSVQRNLELMIKKKYINGYIDLNTKTIRSLHSYGYKYTNPVPNTNPNPNVINTMKAVEFTTSKCNNCGATLKIQKGVTTDCEYCGSPIQ